MSSPIFFRWGKEQREECQTKFYLFQSSNGAEGWDPRNTLPGYIRTKLSESEITKPFLSVRVGGQRNHQALTNYRNAATRIMLKNHHSYSPHKRARTVSSSLDDDHAAAAALSTSHPSVHATGGTSKSPQNNPKTSSSREAIAATAQTICDSACSRLIHAKHTKKKLTNEFVLAKKRAMIDWNKAKDRAELDWKVSMERLEHQHQLTRERLKEYYKLQVERAEQHFDIQQERIKTELQDSIEYQQEAKKLWHLTQEEEEEEGRIIHIDDSDNSGGGGESEEEEEEEEHIIMDQHQVS